MMSYLPEDSNCNDCQNEADKEFPAGMKSFKHCQIILL